MIHKADVNTCNRCGELVVTDHKRGRILCDHCGLIKEARFIDLNSEYRYFTENASLQNDPRRVGNPVNTHLDSQIDLVEIDEGQKSYHMFATQSNTDKMYTRAIKLIKRYCDIMNIDNNILRQVEEIYYEVQEKKELRGKRLEHIIVACIYLACKRNLVNIQPTNLEPIANISQNKILKISKIILNFLPKITTQAYQYAEIFCKKLKVHNDFKVDIVKICKDIEKWDFFNKQLPKPRTIAAAVIYFYLQKQCQKFRKSLSEIKEAAGICTDNTIKKYYKDLEEKTDHINKVIGKDINSCDINNETNENNENVIVEQLIYYIIQKLGFMQFLIKRLIVSLKYNTFDELCCFKRWKKLLNKLQLVQQQQQIQVERIQNYDVQKNDQKIGLLLINNSTVDLSLKVLKILLYKIFYSFLKYIFKQ